MVNRVGWVAFAALSFVACGTVEMSAGEAVASTRAALAEADVAVDHVEVEAAGPEAFTVVASTADGEIGFVLDAGSGRFTSIDIDEGVDVADEQLEDLARHQDNPADDRARTRRSIVGVVVVLAAIAGGLLLARRARLREEASTS